MLRGGSVPTRCVLRVTRGTVAGLHKLGYTYFIIDEPCFTGRDPASGQLLENKTTWPNGLKSFGAELRANGMKLGMCVPS